MNTVSLAPPPLKFLILSYDIVCGVLELTFTCVTDVACHLTLHLTDQEPIIRKIPYTRRGADVMVSSVTCFVELSSLEQAESGDTTTHTFTFPLSAYCQYYYWYLTGTQSGIPMTSISQIFSGHCYEPVTPPITVKLYSGPGATSSGCDCQLHRGPVSEFWASIWPGIQSLCYCGYLQLPVGFWSASSNNRWKYLYRAKFTHNLSSIPIGSTIQSVSFHWLLHSKHNGAGNSLSFAMYDLSTPTPSGCYSNDYNLCGTVPISNLIPYSSLTPGNWYEFVVDPSFFNLFPPGGFSKFSIREALHDAPNSAPIWQSLISCDIQIQSCDNIGASKDPYLEITYLPP